MPRKPATKPATEVSTGLTKRKREADSKNSHELHAMVDRLMERVASAENKLEIEERARGHAEKELRIASGEREKMLKVTKASQEAISTAAAAEKLVGELRERAERAGGELLQYKRSREYVVKEECQD